jgi:5'-3' exoribonuclease 1
MLPTWTGYLVENMGPHINVERFEKLLARISESERAVLMEKEEDIKFMKSKAAGGGRGGGRGRGRGRSAPPPAPTQDELDEADAMDRAIAEMSLGDGSDPVKNRYYFRKLGAEFSDPDLETMKRKYLEGMNWVLGYYYQGCQSWNWFYPYHYAPLASDMVNLEALGDTSAFVLGKPFLPFQQLLGVLPPLSSALLPVPYRSLMTNPASPVFEFFNQELKLDMEGKSFEWEAIVLLPFMVEAKLMSAVDMVRPEQLSEEERKQNILGSDYIFSYDPSIVNAAKSPIPNVLADIPTASCRIEPFCMKPFPPGQTRFIPKLCEGVSTGRNCVPGWPTTGCHFLGLDGKLAEIGVNVFGRPSKRESVLVTLGNQLAPGVDPKLETTPDCWSAEELVTKAGILGKSRWANFPFLIECKVVAVCDGKKKYTSPSPSRPPNERVLQSAEAEQWQRESSALGANHRLRWGLDPGPVTCTVDVRLFTGVKRASKGLGTEKVFSSDVTTLPFQLTLARPPQEDPRFQTISDAAPIEHHFPVDSKVLYVEPPLNGVPATVAGAEGGKIEIAFEHTQGKIPDTFPQTVIKSLKPTLYFPLDFVAKKLKLEYSVVSRVLSVVPLRGERNPETGRWDDGPDIGLQLKFEKRNLCMPGFTQRPPTGRGWQCSVLLVQILQAYNEQFPEVFKALGASSSGGGRGRSGGGRSGGRGRGGGRGGGRRGGDDDFELDPKKIFAGQDPIAKVSQVMKFLGNLPTAKLPLVPATARCYDTVQIAAIEKGGDDFTAANKASKAQSVTRKVSAKALVRPTLVGAHGLGLHGHAGSWELGNRVVNAKNTGTVPFGLRGTVVGFSADNSEVEVVFDRPFLGGDALRGRCSDLRGKQLPVAQLWRLPVRGAPVRPQSAAAAPLGSTPRAAAAAADPAKGSSGSRGRGRDTGKAPAPARQQQVDRLQKLEALEQQRMVQAQQAQQQHQLLLLQQQQAMMQQQMAMQGTDQQQRLAHLQQQEQQRLAASQAQPAQSELPVPAPVVTAQPPSAPAPAVSSLQAQANDLTAARFISGAAAVAAAPATRSIPLTDLFGSAVAKAQEAPAPLPAPDP